MSKPYSPFDRPLMAAVNDELNRLHGELGLPDSELFCECGGVGCKERVKLSRDEFTDLRAEPRPLIVAAHVNGASSAPTTPRSDPHGP